MLLKTFYILQFKKIYLCLTEIWNITVICFFEIFVKMQKQISISYLMDDIPN